MMARRPSLRAWVVGALLALAATPAPALAATEAATLRHQPWSFDGMFGRFDRAQAQRGLQVFRQVCANCHGLEFVAFRDLEGIGYDQEQIKAIAAQWEVTDGPDDQGEMFTRPAGSADRVPSPYANVKAAAAANGGKAPPDLSLMVKARFGGADYVYSLLIAYGQDPGAHEVPEGSNYNPAFPGAAIAMPQPLYGDDVEYADGTAATLDQEAKDVAAFMAWAAEPTMEERKRLGLTTMLYLIVLGALIFASKRKVWRALH